MIVKCPECSNEKEVTKISSKYNKVTNKVETSELCPKCNNAMLSVPKEGKITTFHFIQKPV